MSNSGLIHSAPSDSVGKVATLWAGPGEASNSTSSVDVSDHICTLRILLGIDLTQYTRITLPIDLFWTTRFKRFPAIASPRVDWSRGSCSYRVWTPKIHAKIPLLHLCRLMSPVTKMCRRSVTRSSASPHGCPPNALSLSYPLERKSAHTQ